MISENKIIHKLQQKSFGFIGDDAAVLPDLVGDRYVITKDILVENIHFRRRYFTHKNLAHKALHVNLSDLAAMGAQPLYILCGISVPGNLQEYAMNFLDALTNSCDAEGIILIGGDTTASDSQLYISISAIGQVSENNIKHRHTANDSDVICVIGNLGYAYLGFLALENGREIDEKFMNSFLRPQAKIKEGIWLGEQCSVTSVIDVSDGLYADINRLCVASKKGAVIDLDMIANQHLDSAVSLKTALEGGEDYSLLFTVNRDEFDDLYQSYSEKFQNRLKKVGYITNKQRILFQKDSRIVDFCVNPFTHFGENDEL